MQAVIAKFIFNKNGCSIPVCTERKATGLFVLASFLFATMERVGKLLSLLVDILHVSVLFAKIFLADTIP